MIIGRKSILRFLDRRDREEVRFLFLGFAVAFLRRVGMGEEVKKNQTLSIKLKNTPKYFDC
jgi:hypothetical protein